MTGFYTDMATTAAQMLAEFGMPVTLVQVDLGSYTPGGVNTEAAPANVTRNAVLLDFGKGQENGPGGLIQGGDKRLLLEPGVVPTLEDRIIALGIEYIIKGVGEVNPAGTPVLYDLHLRS